METILFACLAGAAFGAVNVAILTGGKRVADLEAGSLVILAVGLAMMVVAAAVQSVVRGELELDHLWLFLLIGALVPGASIPLITRAVGYAGASRAGVLLGTAPVVSAFVAVVAFDEPLRAGLVAGTVLIVVAGIALTWEPNRPPDFRILGGAIALFVAVLFGLRDNAVRWAAKEVTAPPLVEAAVAFAGAVLVVATYLAVREGGRFPSLRGALAPFLPAGVLMGVSTLLLFLAFDRGRVTVVAPLVATATLWTVVFAALFAGRTEAIGRRLVLVTALIVAGGALIGATR